MRPRPIVALIGAASAATIALFAGCSNTGGSSTIGFFSGEAPAVARADDAPAEPAPLGVKLSGATQSSWARARIEAVERIWNFSPAGRAWLDSYDLRQMPARPAWFGSNGFDSWAGVGQAVPRIVMHELSHSYWGAFPVDGRPDLTGRRGADGVSDVSKSFRTDLEAFLGQPPDLYEPLRDRFRHMPDLESDDYPELYHAGEADLVYMTGGNISLVPPILRKYVSAFYGDRGVGGEAFTEWSGALRWWYGLSPQDRAAAGQVFGLSHFPLDRYASLAGGPRTALSPHVTRVLAEEERQRLTDFADQFASIDFSGRTFVDSAGVDRGFAFWRRYLLEVRDLHERHPEVLRGHPNDASLGLAAAFDFYLDIKALPSVTQAERFRAEYGRPLVSDLSFMLKPKAIERLMADPAFQPGPDGVVAGSDLARVGAQLALAARVAADEIPPGEVRAPEPRKVLKIAGVVEHADVASLTAGVQRLTDHSSGNFMIDQPVDSAIYDILDGLSVSDPRGVMQVFQNSSLRLQPWIETHPERAAATLRSDLAAAATLIEKATDLRSTDVSLVHALIAAGPEVAAGVLIELDRRGVRSGDEHQSTVVARTLNALAYDEYWSSLAAGPRIDLSADAAFFSRLVQVNGAAWVEDSVVAGMALYRRAIADGEVDAEFSSRHADTLARISSLMAPADPAAGLLARLAVEARGS